MRKCGRKIIFNLKKKNYDFEAKQKPVQKSSEVYFTGKVNSV